MADCIPYLGMGYAGYACIDGIYLLLTSSTATEEEGLLKSEGSVSSYINLSAGQTPARNARVLKCQLTSVLTPAVALLIKNAAFNWRRLGFLAKVHALTVIPASKEGYTSLDAYCDTCSISSPAGGLCTASFNFTVYNWTRVGGIPLPKFQEIFTYYNSEVYQPIPNWATTVDFPNQPGDPIDFNLDFSNNYYYGQLLEATSFPPVPRLITSGPLDCKLRFKTLALPDQPPAESGQAIIHMGGMHCGMNVAAPQVDILLPLLIRSPSRNMTGLGEQNAPVYWDCHWELLQGMPYESGRREKKSLNRSYKIKV